MGGFGTEFCPIQLFVQPIHSLPVQVGKLWVKSRTQCRRLFHLRPEPPLARLECVQFLLHAGAAQAVFDSLDDRTDLPLETIEFFLSAFVVALARSI